MKSIKVYGPISGFCFVLWWWSFLLFLPFGSLRDDYSLLIRDPMWLPVNLLQVIGIIAFAMFFLEYAIAYYPKTKAAGLFKLLSMVGIAGFCGVAFYETFLWPVIAQEVPRILDVVSGPIYTSTLFMVSTGIAILAFMAGNIYLGIQMRNQSKWISVIFIAGVVLHCLGYMAGAVRYIVQSAGITMMSAGLISIGFKKTAAHT